MILEILSSPLFITSFIIIIGFLIGKIKFFNISLGLSAILFVALTVGYAIDSSTLFKWVQITTIEKFASEISKLGLALFMAVIGIISGYSLNLKNIKHIKAMAIGAAMVCSAFMIMKLFSCLNVSIPDSKLLGTFCGALTTTPGLSVVCEDMNINSTQLTVSYGITYIFGVMITVVFVQLLSRKSSVSAKIIESDTVSQVSNSFSSVLQIGISIILGVILGYIKIFVFSLGQSGGILFAGLLIGALFKRLFIKQNTPPYIFEPIKNLGLSLFLACNGLIAGIHLDFQFEFEIIFCGIIMAIIPILIGYGLSKLLRFNDDSSIIIAGGMTSTPALAALCNGKKNLSVECYSMAYIGALISIIVLLRVFVL